MSLETKTIVITCLTIVLTGFIKYCFDIMSHDKNLRRKIVIEKYASTVIEMYQILQDVRAAMELYHKLLNTPGADHKKRRMEVIESCNKMRLFYEKNKLIFSISGNELNKSINEYLCFVADTFDMKDQLRSAKEKQLEQIMEKEFLRILIDPLSLSSQ
jgi:hypothetical protein